MSLDIDSLAIDPKLVSEGSWGNFSGASFLIARYNSPEAQRVRNEAVLENLEAIQAGGDKAVAANEVITLRVLTESILLGWKGLTKGGKELKFTKALAKQYLADPRFGELREFVENYSVSRANYQEKTEQAVADTVKTTAAS